MGQACSSRSAEAAAILDPERRYTLAAAVRELQQNTHILHADKPPLAAQDAPSRSEVSMVLRTARPDREGDARTKG